MAASMQTFLRNLTNIRLFCNQRITQASRHNVQQLKYCSTEATEDFYDPRDQFEEWEIKKIRNVSRLPKKNILEMRVKSKNQFEAFYKRPVYIKPKWPNEAELQVIKNYEAEFEPSVETMLKIAREKRMAWDEKNTKRIVLVEQKMEKMELMIQNLRNKEKEKALKAQAAAEKRQRRIEAVRKQLGTRLRPNDKRVKLLLEEKEKAEQKAEKLRKKREKEEKMAEKLRVLAETD